MKVKNSDLYEMFDALVEAKKCRGAKFAYAVNKNFNVVKNVLKPVASLLTMDSSFSKYEKQKRDIVNKYVSKDENGKPVLTEELVDNEIRQVYDIVDKENFEKEIKELNDNNKELLDKKEEEIKKYSEALEKEVEIDIHLVDENGLSEDVTGELLEKLEFMLKK